MSTQQQIDYGVRTFDLSEARDLVRINIRADNIAILRADDSAELRINSPEAAPVDPRELSGITIRNEEDPTQSGIRRLYLSNDPGTGLLRILTGFGGTSGTTDVPTGEEVDVTNREARELGKVRLQDSNGVLLDPATDETLTNTLNRSIQTWDAGTLPVQQDNPLDVSAATVTVQEENPLSVKPQSNTNPEAVSTDPDTGFASKAVPDGVGVILRAPNTNSGTGITIEGAYTLDAGEQITLYPDDLANITTAGDAGDEIIALIGGHT